MEFFSIFKKLKINNNKSIPFWASPEKLTNSTGTGTEGVKKIGEPVRAIFVEVILAVVPVVEKSQARFVKLLIPKPDGNE